MASNTSNLNLLKKDPLTDGNDTFNIKTMLNDNWDKIDEFAGKTTPISKGGTGATTAEQALENLGGIAAGAVGNLHVWERVQKNSEAGYTLESAVSSYVSSSDTNNNYIVTEYADSITVDKSGAITLTSPSRINLWNNSESGHTGESVLKGKFCKFVGGSNGTAKGPYGVWFIPTDCTFTSYTTTSGDIRPYKYTKVASKMQKVTAHAAGTTTDYLTSTDRNAYTDGTVDNTTITYLGQLGEPSAKIEVGSYVGTGTYGESNPNTITFDFAPKLVWIIGPSNGSFNVTNTPVLLIYDRTFYYNGDIENTTASLNLSVKWGDKSVSYYYKSGFNGYEAVAQLNANGKTYSYIAIG